MTKQTNKLDETLQGRKFIAANKIEKPNSIISIQGSLLTTPGNLTTISGQSKAGKTGVVGAILAGSIQKVKSKVDTLGMSIAFNKESKGILHIDTEQSRHDHDRLNRTILKRASLKTEPDFYYSYQLSGLSPKSLEEITEFLIEDISKNHNGMHLVIIDGVGDYVTSVNDVDQSNAIVTMFTNLASTYNVPVVLVLHKNPTSSRGYSKARGHLGSQLERKSETMLNVSRGKSGLSKIESHIARNAGDFGSLTFKFDEKVGYHTLESVKTSEELDNEKEAEKESRKKVNEAQDTAKYKKAFSDALGNNSFTKSTLVSILEDSDVCVKKTAYTWITKLIANEFLIEEDKKIKLKIVV